ncbi:Epidermal growth factor receptor kinase substrate 8-like, variant 2 [Dermatophagoides farinae]|uniref:Epidermal growth factor receptor kinase substrate 8-like, variant 2 n=1 Tax=Dermatophagoides farinae TaxID=6954 RepID=A0A922HT89_DERFA|nr:Epidermal growth factor receptor kinase substrate 8-like, variant 2 [Dermatophagoides farinae]
MDLIGMNYHLLLDQNKQFQQQIEEKTKINRNLQLQIINFHFVYPSLVGIPYLSPDAIELLSNCCTSKEFDLWQSLGNNWIQSVKHVRMTIPFQPILTDGWAPSITEPELLGIIVPT